MITRDGRAAKIHCTNYNSNFPIIAEIEGAHSSDSFNKEGKFYQISNSENDLFFAPEKHKGWMNIYKFSMPSGDYKGSFIWPTEEEAKSAADSDPVATVKIEWEE